ncbi:MmyB family transcriptional regulator [Streptomyces avermitilis]
MRGDSDVVCLRGAPVGEPRPHKAARPAAERVPVSIKYMLAQMSMPAFVHGRYFDVLAANPLARALSPNMARGVNRLRAAFLDPRSGLDQQSKLPDAMHAHGPWDQHDV